MTKIEAASAGVRSALSGEVVGWEDYAVYTPIWIWMTTTMTTTMEILGGSAGIYFFV